MWKERHLSCLADSRLSLKAALLLLGGQCHVPRSSVLHESHFSRLLFIDCKLSYQRTYCHSSIKAKTFCRTPYTSCLGSLLSSQALHTEDFVLLNPVSSSPSSQGGSDAAKRKIRKKKQNTSCVSVIKHWVSPLLYNWYFGKNKWEWLTMLILVSERYNTGGEYSGSIGCIAVCFADFSLCWQVKETLIIFHFFSSQSEPHLT